MRTIPHFRALFAIAAFAIATMMMFSASVLSAQTASTSDNRPEPRIVSATVRVDGLTCSLCHRSVYKALKKLNFVENLAPNLDETSLDITFTRNNVVSFDHIAEAIQDAGFSVGILRASIEFPPTVVRNDEPLALAGGAMLHFVNIPEERTIQGRVEVKLIDAKFIPETEVAEWRTKVHHSSYKTGAVEEYYPPSEGQSAGGRVKVATRVYHCTL